MEFCTYQWESINYYSFNTAFNKINMKKLQLSILYCLPLLALSISCKKDEPFVKPKMSFTAAEQTVKESDGTIQIEISLDKPTIEDFTISYTLSGTAKDKASVATNAPYDYEVLSGDGQIEIKKGEKTGTIEISLVSDFYLEDEETIDIAITKVSSKNIEITRDDDMTITVQQEDGLLVVLAWGVGTGENYTDVDMDLFLWAQSGSSLELTDFGSSAISFESPEFFFLPTAGINDGSYGVSCIYYEGTQDPMNFQVSFIEIVNQDDAATTVKKGTYHLANINEWDNETTGTKPILAATFSKSGADFNNFTDITVLPTGSRSTTFSDIPSTIKKQNTPIPYSKKVFSLLSNGK